MSITEFEDKRLNEFMITDIWEILLKFLQWIEEQKKNSIWELLWENADKWRDEYLKCMWMIELIDMIRIKRETEQDEIKQLIKTKKQKV